MEEVVRKHLLQQGVTGDEAEEWAGHLCASLVPSSEEEPSANGATADEVPNAPEADGRLAALLRAWPSTPDPIKVGIIAMVDAAKTKGEQS